MTNLKIIEKYNKTKYAQVNIGDVFRSGGNIYIKVWPSGLSAFDMLRKKCYEFGPDSEVEVANVVNINVEF
jgi:hypothetical protein